MERYMLYNTETETLETYQLMDEDEAKSRNEDLEAWNDPQRWILVGYEEEDEAAELDTYRV